MDNAKIDLIIDTHGGDAGSLIKTLLEIQKETRWLPKEILEKVSRKFNVPLSKVEHIATFYKSLNTIPEGRHQVHVCNGTTCHLRGSGRVIEAVQDLTGIRPGETDAELKFSLDAVTCMGNCASGPVMTVDGKQVGKMTPDKAEGILKGCK